MVDCAVPPIALKSSNPRGKSITEESIFLHNYNFNPPPDFFDFNYTLLQMPIAESTSAVLYMIKHMEFDKKYKIPTSTLIRFIACARLGYRDLPYHNWRHACSVTHFSFLLLKNLDLVANGYLNDIEAFSLLIASITHDIDHRGTNNQFEVCSESCLYQLYREYDSSIMERHHLDFTLAILNRDDCNILEKMSDKDVKDFLKLLSHNILATDITKYMSNRESEFRSLSGCPKYKQEFRLALLSCCMTAADLCECSIGWDDTLPIVECVFTEFFVQGDLERNMGWKPAHIQDRNHAYIPEIEIKFLKYVVRPVYENLALQFAPVQFCVDNIDNLIELWLVSTEVFNKYGDTYDPLEILTFDEIKESNLQKLYTPELIKQLRHKDFSQMRADSLESEKSLQSFRILPLTASEEKSSWFWCCKPKRKKKRRYTVVV